MTHWVMMSERAHERELSIDGTPPLVEQHDWNFHRGIAQPASLPLIEVPVRIHAGTRMIDNVPASGCRGLLINERVKAVFDGLGLENLQYYPARLVDTLTGPVPAPFWIANIIGTRACVDHERSELDYYGDGQVRFIDRLALKPLPDAPRIFRLAEFLPAVIVSDEVRDALVAQGITGFAFYRPEAFSL